MTEINSQSINASWTLNQASNDLSESKSSSINLEYEQIFLTEKENYQNKSQIKVPSFFEGGTLNFLCPDEEKLIKIIDIKNQDQPSYEPFVIK
jgi:hypothetical protein